MSLPAARRAMLAALDDVVWRKRPRRGMSGAPDASSSAGYGSCATRPGVTVQLVEFSVARFWHDGDVLAIHVELVDVSTNATR